MDDYIYEYSRRKLGQRIAALSDDDLNALGQKTLGERIKWGVTQLSEISDGMLNTSRLSERLGRSRGLLYQLIDNRSQNPTMDVLKQLELEMGLPIWFVMGRMDQRDKGSGPASMIDRLPAHLREDISLGRNLGIITEALELAHLVIERNWGQGTITELRQMLETRK